MIRSHKLSVGFKLQFLVFFLFYFCVAQSEEVERFYPLADSSRVAAPELKQAVLEGYRHDSDFQYQQPSVDTLNIWMQLKSLLQRFREDVAFLLGGIPVLFRILLWGAVVILLVVIFTKSSLYRVYTSEKKVQAPDFNISQPHAEELDPDSLILEAEDQQQFRLAIRYWFLTQLV